MKEKIVNIIGGGYAGTEAALTLASYGVEVHLFNLPQPLPEKISLSAINKKLVKELLALKVKSIESANLKDICKKNEKKLNGNAKIMLFDKKVTDISLNEPTIIATGGCTHQSFLPQIEQIVGKTHLEKFMGLYPDFKGKIDGIVEGETLFLPIEEGEYQNVFKYLRNFKSDKMSIEKFAGGGEQVFKAKVIKPAFVNGKVYQHALKFKNIFGLWRLVGFQTELDSQAQKEMFSLLGGLKNCKISRYGSINDFVHIKSVDCLNEHLQSQKFPNIFFAGAILGVDGELEAIASGHLAALNVISMLDGGKLASYPKNSNLGRVFGKLFSSKDIKSDQILKSCDIIEKTDGLDATQALKKFKEEWDARFSWYNNMCSKKRW